MRANVKELVDAEGAAQKWLMRRVSICDDLFVRKHAVNVPQPRYWTASGALLFKAARSAQSERYKFNGLHGRFLLPFFYLFTSSYKETKRLCLHFFVFFLNFNYLPLDRLVFVVVDVAVNAALCGALLEERYNM